MSRRRRRDSAARLEEREQLVQDIDAMSTWIVDVTPTGSEMEAWSHLSTLSMLRKLVKPQKH